MSPQPQLGRQPEAFAVTGTNYRLERVHPTWKHEPLGAVLIWEGPKRGHRYVIGCDPADGVGGSRSAIEVNRVGTKDEPDELVAEWCGDISPFYLPPLLYTLGKLYQDSDGLEALMCIEVNRGDVAQVELRQRYGYTNFFVWKHYDSATNQFSTKLGWVTNADTRPKLFARGVHSIRERRWRINSPWLVHELSRIEYDQVRTRMGAGPAAHDDRVMAGFIALFCSKDWEFDEEVTARVERKIEDVNELANRGNFQTLDVAADGIYNEGDFEFSDLVGF